MSDHELWPPPADEPADRGGPGDKGLPRYLGSGSEPAAGSGWAAPSFEGGPFSQPAAGKWPRGAEDYPEAGDDEPCAAFGAPLARWWQRVGAMLIDALLVGVVTTVVTFPFDHGSSRGHPNLSTAVTIVSVALSAVYFTILNGIRGGQTFGNRAPGIAVRDATSGAPIGLGRSLLRWLVRSVLYAAFLIPGILNDLFPLWDSRRQTLADKAVRSVMIRVR